MTRVALGKARFAITPTLDGEVLTIPARRYILQMAFYSVWLPFWTAAGLVSLSGILNNFHPLIVFWLVGWALGWCVVALTLAWMLSGRQTLRFLGSDLELTTFILGHSRRRLFRGVDIRNLTAVAGAETRGRQRVPPTPILHAEFGSVRFNYGASTCSCAYGMNYAEAREIVGWLGKRLPKASGV